MDFWQSKLSTALAGVLKSMGYSAFTPVQARCIPVLLEGRDVIGQAMTGSGKTAAFAIGLLERIDMRHRTPQALVLCPTRELVNQVAENVRKIGRYLPNLQVRTLYGGRPARMEMRSLEHGVHVIVGTPGRIQDHLDRGTLRFSTIKTVVLDEADRMLDMGFREKIEAILEHTPKDRQTVLFSATFPSTIQTLSARIQNRPEHIVVEAPASELPEIEQVLYRCQPQEKIRALVSFLRNRPLESVLVFCNLKVGVKELATELSQAGVPADPLHGDLEQHDRERVMAKFRNQSTRVLVATDVAARGIDVAGLDAVINFDLPSEPEVYVHRIGRTGRAGRKGLAVSLVTDAEGAKVERLQGALQLTLKTQPAALLEQAATRTMAPAAAMKTLAIAAGRRSKLRAGDILGALTGEAGIPADHVGKIEIQERVSFVAISSASAKKAHQHFQHGKIKGRRFVVEWVR